MARVTRGARWATAVVMLGTLFSGSLGTQAAQLTSLEAASPVAVAGAATLVLGNGSFLSARSATPTFHLHAHLDQVTYHQFEDRAECPQGPIDPAYCPIEMLGDFHGQKESLTLRDVSIDASRPRPDFLLVLAIPRGEDGRISLSQRNSETGQVLAPSPGMNATTTDSAWVSYRFQFEASGSDFLYEAAAPTGAATAEGATQVVLQGMQVTISGTAPNGTPFARTVDAGEHPEPGATPPRTAYDLVVVDSTGGAFGIGGAGGWLAAGRPTISMEEGLTLLRPSGPGVSALERTADGGGRLPGPVEFRPIAGASRTDRIRLQFESAAPIPRHTGPARLSDWALFAGLLLPFAFPLVRRWSAQALMALYSRLQPRDLLQHEGRAVLVEVIRAHPGEHGLEIAALAGMPWETAAHHLRRLQQAGLVESRRQGRYRRYFLRGAIPSELHAAIRLLRNQPAARLAREVRRAPGIGFRALADNLGISPSLLSWHLRRLVEAGLVRRSRQGRKVTLFPGLAWNGLPEGLC